MISGSHYGVALSRTRSLSLYLLLFQMLLNKWYIKQSQISPIFWWLIWIVSKNRNDYQVAYIIKLYRSPGIEGVRSWRNGNREVMELHTRYWNRSTTAQRRRQNICWLAQWSSHWLVDKHFRYHCTFHKNDRYNSSAFACSRCHFLFMFVGMQLSNLSSLISTCLLIPLPITNKCHWNSAQMNTSTEPYSVHLLRALSTIQGMLYMLLFGRASDSRYTSSNKKRIKMCKPSSFHHLSVRDWLLLF